MSERVISDPEDLPEGEFESLDAEGGRVFSVQRYHLGPECHVEWSGYLTSAARVEWHKEAVSAGRSGEDLVYCDTDSMYVESSRTRRIGSRLGQWEYKGSYEYFHCRAPKLYRYWREGTLQIKAKGLSLPKVKGISDELLRVQLLDDAWSALECGLVLPREGIVGFSKGAADAHFFQRLHGAGRSAAQGFGDRILEPGATMTRAPSVEEAAAL